MTQRAGFPSDRSHHDRRREGTGDAVAASVAPAPRDYPDLSPELAAIFEMDWLKDPRGVAALLYLAK